MKKILVLALCFMTLGFAQAQKQITLEDIWSQNTFNYKTIDDIRSMKNGQQYCVLTRKSIDKYSYKTGKKEGEIINFSQLNFPNAGKKNYVYDYSFSEDEQQVLLVVNPEFIYRRSFVADYYIYDLGSKTLYPLTDGRKVRLAAFSPDGKKVAWTYQNNIYVSFLDQKDSKGNFKVTQITTDGKQNQVIYGASDWVYEEELTLVYGYEWNKESNKLAYYRFDESKVKEYSFPVYGNLYPDQYTYKYPKAGEANSVVDIYVYNLATNASKQVDLGTNKDYYIPRIQWQGTTNNLLIHKLNRLQNQYDIYCVNTSDYTTKTIYSETNKCYIDNVDKVHFLNDNNRFIIKSEREGYNRFYLCNVKNGSIQAITTGNYDVDELCFIDQKSKKIYYTAAESSAINRELCVVGFDGKHKRLLSTQTGTNGAEFSKSGEYYIATYSNGNTPTVYTINNKEGNVLVTLEDNKALKQTLADYGAEKKEFSSFTTTQGTSLNYWIIKPSNMENGKKYPVLFYVYGGPASQEVLNSTDRFRDYLWFRMLAQQGYICVCVDPRGTGMRGEDFRKCTYMQMGKYEIEDIIEAAKYFGSLDYVDKGRIGIFGWSFGGYMSTLAITKGADYFKSAIAVAPVTTWRYYDNIYTERFMRTPQENGDNYDINSPINHVEKLKGNFLLIQGTADDNVHYQNSMDLIDALIKAGKQFEHFAYPNKNHSIYGGNTRLHLYTMMTNFLKAKL